MSLLPTKLLMSWEDIGADHSDVPAWLWRLQAFTVLDFSGKVLVSSADVRARRHFDLFVVSWSWNLAFNFRCSGLLDSSFLGCRVASGV